MTTLTARPCDFLRVPRREYTPPNERAMADLWRNAHTLSEGLVTQGGRRWQVVYPGRPGDGAGPDFRDAVFTDDRGDLVFGDVELHLNARDWYGHRHHVDPGYDGVVLHVVFHPSGGGLTVLHSGAAVPVAAMDDIVDELLHAGGGTKKGQNKDIQKAKELWVNYKRRKKEE